MIVRLEMPGGLWESLVEVDLGVGVRGNAPKSTQGWPTKGWRWHSLVGFGKIWVGFDQIRVGFSQIWAEFGRIQEGSDRTSWARTR